VTHLVEVDTNEDGELYVARFMCRAAPDALCRSWCVECEEECTAPSVYVAAEPLDPVAQAPVDAHRFAPLDPPGERCRVVDWLGAGDAYDREELYAGDDLDERNRVILRPGLRPIEESWDGDSYLWEYADEAASREEPEPPGRPL
jgi:hypothetical protein